MTSSSVPDLRVVDAIDDAVAAHVQSLMAIALPADERDDRFDGWPDRGAPSGPTDDVLAVLATEDGRPIGYLGGGVVDGRRQLDALLAPDVASTTAATLIHTSATGAGAPTNPTDTGTGAPTSATDTSVTDAGAPTSAAGAASATEGAGETGGASRVRASEAGGHLLGAMLERIAPLLRERGEAEVELWAKPTRPWHEAVVAAGDFEPYRGLHQMRCRLPVDVAPLPTRPYTDADFEALRTINNRAFAAHPDQGAQSPESLAETIAEDWFRPDGVRLYEQDGRIAGFCWTKIHPSPPAATELGEIYVIGVDPDFHGQGLGAPMTAAGLSWLTEQGISTGMLYVEADNIPAIRTYERLGFTILRTDRAWIWRPAGRER